MQGVTELPPVGAIRSTSRSHEPSAGADPTSERRRSSSTIDDDWMLVNHVTPHGAESDPSPLRPQRSSQEVRSSSAPPKISIDELWRNFWEAVASREPHRISEVRDTLATEYSIKRHTSKVRTPRNTMFKLLDALVVAAHSPTASHCKIVAALAQEAVSKSKKPTDPERTVHIAFGKQILEQALPQLLSQSCVAASQLTTLQERVDAYAQIWHTALTSFCWDQETKSVDQTKARTFFDAVCATGKLTPEHISELYHCYGSVVGTWLPIAMNVDQSTLEQVRNHTEAFFLTMLTGDPPTRDPWDEDPTVCRQYGRTDRPRQHMLLKDPQGSVLSETEKDSNAEFTNDLRHFCDDDPNLTFRVSQALTQGIGNGLVGVIAKIQCLHVIGQGANLVCAPDASHTQYTVTQDLLGDVLVHFELTMTRVDAIALSPSGETFKPHDNATIAYSATVRVPRNADITPSVIAVTLECNGLTCVPWRDP